MLGRYSKRHMLLLQELIDLDAGDPIFYSADPFEMIHKLKTRPAYSLSTKHSATVGEHILRKVCLGISHSSTLCDPRAILITLTRRIFSTDFSLSLYPLRWACRLARRLRHLTRRPLWSLYVTRSLILARLRPCYPQRLSRTS